MPPYRGAMKPIPFDAASGDRFLATVSAFDAHPPLSGHKLDVIARQQGRVGAWADAEGICLVGVAAHHTGHGHWAVEAAVAARRRNPAEEEAALRHVIGLVPGDQAHTLWAFREGQVEAASRLGYTETRCVLRLSGPMSGVAHVPAAGVLITPITKADVATIVAINNRAFADHREQAGMTVEAFHDLIRAEGFGAGATVVARTQQGIVGFCVTKQDGSGVGEVYLLAVDPEFAGSGYGSMLASAGFEQLASHDATTAVVWVDGSNHAARHVYRKLGLTEDFRNREMAPLTE